MINACEFKDARKGKTKEELIDEMWIIYSEKEKLENELKKFKNPNTPSSANKHLKESTVGLKAKENAKRGAPKGHKGATLVLPPPEEIIPVTADNCDKCNSINIEPTGYIKKRTVLCYQTAKIIVKQYNQYEYRCLDCHALTLAKHRDIPERGIYCKTILSLVNYYKFKARLPHNILVDVMNNIHNVPMTEPTSLEITNRVSKQLEPKYEELEKQVRESQVVNADETSCSVNGVNHWIWVFCNSLISLFKFHKKRGGDIVERTLGKDFKGKIVADGWKTYFAYSRDNNVLLQRCWSHGTREVEFECKKDYNSLYVWYCDIYGLAKRGKSYRQRKRRLDMFKKCKDELARWIACARVHSDLRKLATKIENGGDNWFTSILHPEVPLDNNEAERSLRPFVIIRKIIGCLRSEIGVRTYEIMMSLISTWEKQHKNTLHTLQAML